MKKLIIPIKLPDLRSTVDCPADGVPKSVVMSIERVEGSLILSAGNEGKQAVREVLNVILECHPQEDEEGNIKDPKIVQRTFHICKSGEVVEGPQVVYVGSAPSMQHGILFHVFEIHSSSWIGR